MEEGDPEVVRNVIAAGGCCRLPGTLLICEWWAERCRRKFSACSMSDSVGLARFQRLCQRPGGGGTVVAADCQRLPEEVEEFWGAGDTRAVLGPQLATSCRQPRGRTGQDVHHPGTKANVEALARGPIARSAGPSPLKSPMASALPN